jgi:hypothetical protein
VSVKFDAVGRTHHFLLPEVGFDPPIDPGDEVVVASGERESFGRVTHSIPQLDAKRASVGTVRNRVVRRATKQDVTQRLKQQRREREGHRVGVMKIKERGLAMKLVKVEQQFDGPRLVFFFTASSPRSRVSTFASWSRSWRLSFDVGSRCGRLVPETRPGCSGDMEPAGGRCAARPGSRGSSRSRSRWPSSRT